MEFDKSKVYTAVNADELKVGSQVICADDLADIIDIHERIKQAYLAGLKAGRPKWHKVADGDLPPTSGEMHAERYPILACTKNGYVTVAIRRKHGRAYEWFCSDYDGNTLYLDKEVIAWCEISKYTEE